VFDLLTRLITDSPASYLIIAGIVCVDSFFPLVPGETAAITGGLLAANHHLYPVIVLVATWVGGMAGDNITYALGRALGVRARRRFFRSDKALRRLAWAEVQLERRCGPIIVAARFIPGGRTATMFSASSLETPWKTFALAEAVAAAAWAVYAVGLGFLGGETFQHSVWKPLGIAVAVAAIVTGGGELYRRLRLPGESRAVKRRTRELELEQRAGP
jgi:membrane protein DedA with SNARE-associated domain